MNAAVNRDTERKLLTDGGAQFDLKIDRARADTLLDLVDELEVANAQFNLTAIRDRLGMLRKHVLDSLSVQPFLKGTRIADVGTGAGFPGLPLAVVNPERRFSLIEATGKKARFVERTVERLGLHNVEVVNERAERFRPLQSFDTTLARALSSLSDFVAYAGHLCAPDGRLLAMKGKRPDEEIWALPKSFRVVAVHRIKLPGLDDERHIVELSPAGRGSAIRPKASTR
jgi:16S rRNA (guanine527-N7)-methyltransferase